MNDLFESLLVKELNARQKNIVRSPKQGGAGDRDSLPYLEHLRIDIKDKTQPIQFTPNVNEMIHRWAPYVQGFSASFVQSVFDFYRSEYDNPVILDPFAGCGTVLVQAKLNGFESYGTELNPLLQFIANIKLNCWDVSPSYLLKIYNSLLKDHPGNAPEFLKSESQFRPGVLKNLQIIKGGIDALDAVNEKTSKAKDLLRLAFSSILIDCSNLKRSPCLGYCRNKKVHDTAPFVLMEQKIHTIADDLSLIQREYKDYINVTSNVFLADAMNFPHRERFDLVITSPPYMNGLDYVMNYKIEMGWLGYAKNHKDLKSIKDSMVVCDNVSKGMIKDFSQSERIYTNEWIEDIKTRIADSIIQRGFYRREDMPTIVHKYFHDMYKTMKNIAPSLNTGGRFILVVGDSLIADVYVPTDLLIARIGKDLGLEIEKIVKARERRSGQIKSYKLRETIITLIKR
jgi:DNA modification methylase